MRPPDTGSDRPLAALTAHRAVILSVTTTRPEPLAGHGDLSLAQGIALYLGAVLGTGVITLPALAARIAGPASLLAWLGLMVLSALLATTFAAMAARHPDAGGISTYARLAFGPRTAAAVGWWFFLAVPAGAPAAALFAGAYVEAAFGGGDLVRYATAAGLFLVVGVCNYVGVNLSSRIQLALSALLVVLLIIASVAALPDADPANLRPFAPQGWAAIGAAAALLVWSFAGWEAVTHLAAEFRRPARDLPRAAGAAVVIVSVLYLLVVAAGILVLGPALGHTEAPLVELLGRGFGRPARGVGAVVAVLLTAGVMNSYAASAAKLGAALGRDGALPRWLAPGHHGGQVPRRSLTVQLVLGLALLAAVGCAGMGTSPLVRVASASFVAVYMVGCAAAIRLLPRRSAGRRTAAAALLVVLGVLAMTGPYLIWPVTVGCAALLYVRHSRP